MDVPAIIYIYVAGMLAWVVLQGVLGSDGETVAFAPFWPLVVAAGLAFCVIIAAAFLGDWIKEKLT